MNEEVNKDKEKNQDKLFNMSAMKWFNIIVASIVVITLVFGAVTVKMWLHREKVLKKVIERLTADSRAAEVIVTRTEYDDESKKIKTTIKFLEYGVDGRALKPKYFTFEGNIIQFQSLVIRFQDDLIKKGDGLQGKSAYLFMKAFVLDDKNTQIFDITTVDAVPRGYKVKGLDSDYENELWQKFWEYALDPDKRTQAGIKNAQIEAPGSMFLPGTLYTLKIEHDGGIRIDTQPIPEILKGEQINA